ncbi:AI-2E family transporter [Cellulomonas sp.]|uniref:AI-2E family transporter n=1 Tax=Cellulomonas sp. TaxID=40001 RepID=UPI001B0E745C|nr:AI-2E family transporter [Cellulomonas sp.]MBO9554353.1 AI-2E family transporter [Cellulomonas sp.]
MASPQGLAPATRTLLTLAAFVVALAGVHAAQDILAPVVLAAVLVVIVHPIRHPLERRGWPRWLATTTVIVTAYLILAVLMAMLVFAGVRFAALVQDFLPELQSAASAVTDRLAELGLDQQAADAAADFLNPSALLSVATTVSGTVVNVASTLFVVVTYILFMSVDAARYDGARGLFGSERRSELDRATALNVGVRRYFVVSATFGGIVAVIDGLALLWLGVPAPAVWAILAFVTNFIPNIGFVLGVIPPTVLALVVGGWPLALAVVAVYSIVNVVLQVLVQPKFVADAVNITLTLSFASVVFWTFVIGPLGAILAVPLTLLTRAMLLQGGAPTAWYAWLSGDDAVPTPDGPQSPPSSGAPPAERTEPPAPTDDPDPVPA